MKHLLGLVLEPVPCVIHSAPVPQASNRQLMNDTSFTVSVEDPNPLAAAEFRSHTAGCVVLPAVPVIDTNVQFRNLLSHSSTPATPKSLLFEKLHLVKFRLSA